MAVSFEQGKDLWNRSQGLINQAIGRGSEMLASRVDHYAALVNDLGNSLREKDEPQAAEFVEMLAGGVHDAAEYLRSHDGGELWSDAQEFARGRTWLLAGLGFVGGMAAARAVRAGRAQHDWEQSDYTESYVKSGYGVRSYDEMSGQTSFGESSYNGSNTERL